MKIQVLKNKAGKWFWRIKARNGKILAHSETYSSKQAALKTAQNTWDAFIYASSKFEVTES